MITIAVAACFATTLFAADQDNPYRRAKVGDWAEYKMTGPNIEGTTKMTVVSKSDNEVTYEITSTFSFMGNTTVAPVQTIKIDLTKPYDAISAANLKANNVKIETLEEGKEKVKAAGKEYETTWKKLRSTAAANGMTIVSDYQMWFCKDVPLGGLVRMDTTISDVRTRVELVGTGKK
jgi:hypothetical protein